MSDDFIEAVIFAEFDIDKGSTCRVQYPKEVGDAGLLAELMLPEGVHNHFQDWTVFMLNRPEQSAPPKAPRDADGKAAAAAWSVHAYMYDTEDESAGWALIHRGGASDASHTVSVEPPEQAGGASSIVINLGDGERLTIQCHEELQYSALQPDFASMYTLDGDAIGLHFRAPEDQSAFAGAVERAAAAASPMLWCLNHVSNRRDTSVRRGAQVKALAICSRHRFIHVWKPVLMMAVDRMYSLSTGLGEYSEPPEEQCRVLFEALNALPASSLPPVTDLHRQAHRLMLTHGTAQRETVPIGKGVQWPPGTASHIPLRVPLALQPEELAESSVSDLLRRFGKGLLTVFHALVQQRRVCFLGHSQPAETVCLAVLSSPLLVCPPMANLLARCYPYTTLNNLDFLSVDGFIAGTTNPIFESHPEWWDVLCDIDTGKVYVPVPGDKGRKVAGEPPRLSEADEELYELVSSGMEQRLSEHWLRACFQERAQALMCESLRGSPAVIKSMGPSAEAPSPDAVAQYVEQLRTGQRMTDKDMVHILSGILAFVADEERLARLLSLLPASSPLGCLSPLASALYHPNPAVRSLAASLVRAVDAHPAAKSCVSTLNGFLLAGLQSQPDTR